MKKKIKIFALPSHINKERVSGVDFLRVIQPMQALSKYKDPEVDFEVFVYDPKEDNGLDWRVLVPKYDIFYLNYTANPWAFAAMGSMVRKHNKVMVLDLDDLIWNIKQDNAAHEVYKKGTEALHNLTAICNEVDYITCTNNYLKNGIISNTKKTPDKVVVFDNYIDLDNLYTFRPEFKDTNDILITWFGSSSHYIDLQDGQFVKAIDRIMKAYPNVRFKTVGALIPEFRYKWGQRYINDFGDTDIYKWIKERYPKFMEEADIVVAPLSDVTYDRAKSATKFNEYSAAKKPGVYQDIRQYQEVVEHGVNGYLAKSDGDWYRSLKALIDDAKHRKEVGEAAFKTIEGRQMKDHVYKYAEFFKKIV